MPNDFPGLSNVVTYMADFFYPCTNKFMTYEDFKARYASTLTVEDFTELRYILKLSLQILQFPQDKLCTAVYPIRPHIAEIAFLAPKGCSPYSKLLSCKNNVKLNMSQRERKWHLELGTTYSYTFWEKVRKFCSSICNENNIKWLQFQIVRNSLQTNKIVHHFKPQITNLCSFCSNSEETVSHLFWFCSATTNFLKQVVDLVNSSGLEFSPCMRDFIFGILDESYSTPSNYLILHIKRFIWCSKFNSQSLSLVGFKSYFKNVLKELKILYKLTEKNISDFDVWKPLLSLI